MNTPALPATMSGYVVVAVVVVLVTLLLTGCSKTIRESDVFFPRSHRQGDEIPGRRNITIRVSDDIALGGWHYQNPSNAATMIFFYGNGETVLDDRMRLEWLHAELGVDVYAVDYRGYGFSDGSPRIEALLEDSVRIYDSLRADLEQSDHRVIIYGRSIGTIAALHLATERPVDGLVLEAPFTSFRDVVAAWDRGMTAPARWLIRLRPEKRLADLEPQPQDVIANYEGPLLIFHGDRDTVIPQDLGRAMFDAASAERKEWIDVPGRGHNDLSLSHPDVEPALKAFVTGLE